jgi:hypothetical protein
LISLSIEVKGKPTPIANYSERELEQNVCCKNCTLEYAIFKKFGYCSYYGIHNSHDIFITNIELFKKLLLLSQNSEPKISKLIIEDALENPISTKINTANGNVEDKKFRVSDFSKIDFSGTGKIIIEQNNSESLVVEAEEDVIQNLRVEKVGDKLIISFKRKMINIIPTKDIIFHLKVKNLENINISGADGSVEKID